MRELISRGDAVLQAIDAGTLFLYVAIGWVIFKEYRGTRNIGFLVIGCGVAVWPLANTSLIRLITHFTLPSEIWLELALREVSKVVQAGIILFGFSLIARSLQMASSVSGEEPRQ